MQVSMRLANVWHTGLIRRPGVLCTVQGEHTGEFTDCQRRVTARARASQRERERQKTA